MKKLGYLLFPLLTLGVGALAGYFAAPGIETIYPLLEKSSLTPPGYVFPIVWTVLYILMGLGLADVVRRKGEGFETAVFLWSMQLVLNFSWSLLFFGFGAYSAALACLIVLWIFIFLMILAFHPISRLAARIQIPYLLWVGFAGYLNWVICQLNP